MTRVMYRNSCSTLQDEGDRETENWEEVGLCKCCIKTILYVHIFPFSGHLLFSKDT